METIDAKGLACPTPIIKAKKALRSNSEIAVEVDDEEAAENLEKMAQQLQYDFAKEDLGSGITKVTIKKTAPTTASAADYNGSSITNMMSVTQTAEESTVQKIDRRWLIIFAYPMVILSLLAPTLWDMGMIN